MITNFTMDSSCVDELTLQARPISLVICANRGEAYPPAGEWTSTLFRDCFRLQRWSPSRWFGMDTTITYSMGPLFYPGETRKVLETLRV